MTGRQAPSAAILRTALPARQVIPVHANPVVSPSDHGMMRAILQARCGGGRWTTPVLSRDLRSNRPEEDDRLSEDENPDHRCQQNEVNADGITLEGALNGKLKASDQDPAGGNPDQRD